MNKERVLLGTVGVDSGSLIIGDPCYIDHSWIRQSESEIVGVKYWGQAQETITPQLEKEFALSKHGAHPYLIPIKENDYDRVSSRVHELAKEVGEVIITSPYRTSSYQDTSNQVLSKKGYGTTDTIDMVAFTSGLGDGVYEVYGTFVELDGWGRRLAKVEVELIPEDL